MSLFHNLLLIGTKPNNKLEEALLGFLKENIEAAEFEGILKTERITILVKEPPKAGGNSVGLRPLVIDGAGGGPALCVFTHPDRSLGMRKRVPEYGHALETDFTGVLSIAPPGTGLVFNAGTLFSTELPPEGVDALRP